MMNFRDQFKGEALTSFLVKSPIPDDPEYENKIDEIVDFALNCGAQFMGSNVSIKDGEVNNRLFLDRIAEGGLKINIYSINSNEEMDAYFNPVENDETEPLLDGMITNRTDLTIHFCKKHNSRPIESSQDSVEIILDELEYRP